MAFQVYINGKPKGRTYETFEEADVVATEVGGDVRRAAPKTDSTKAQARQPAPKKEEPNYLKAAGKGLTSAAKVPYALLATIPGAAKAAYGKLTADEGDTTSYFAPVAEHWQDIMDRPQAAQSVFEQIFTDPTMLVPGVQEASLTTKIASPLLRKAAAGAATGAEQAAMSSLYRGIDTEEGTSPVTAGENILAGAGLGAVVPPVLAGFGRMAQAGGRKILDKAIRVPETVMEYAANPPDPSVLFQLPAIDRPSSAWQKLKNYASGSNANSPRNIVPYFGGARGLATAFQGELNRVGAQNPEVIQTLAKAPDYRVDLDTPMGLFLQKMQKDFKAGKIGQEDLLTVAKLVEKEKQDLTQQTASRLADATKNTQKLQELGLSKRDIELLTYGMPLNSAEVERIGELQRQVAGPLGVDLNYVPFDIAANTRGRWNQSSNWDKTFDPKRDVAAEDAYRELASNLTNTLTSTAETGNNAAWLAGIQGGDIFQGMFKPDEYQIYQLARQLSGGNEVPTAAAKAAAEKWLKSQKQFRALMPLKTPIVKAANKEDRNMSVGLAPLVLAAGGVGSGNLGGLAAGLGGASAIGLSRSPGSASALYDLGAQLGNERQSVLRAALRIINEENED